MKPWLSAAGGGRHRAKRRRWRALGAMVGTGLLIGGIGLVEGAAPKPSSPNVVDDTTESPRVPDMTRSARPTPPVAMPPENRSSATTPPPQRAQRPERVRIPRSGSGEFAVADGQGPAGPTDLTYTVEIERGLPFTPSTTAARVSAALDDDRGWIAVRGTTFRRVTEGASLRILVATPATTDGLCAPLLTRGQVSCRNGDLVVLNARRWAFGVPHYRNLLADYRRYLVNHEVGHAIGEAHATCPGPGQPAPVMQQQTYGLEGCARNPWPASGR